MTDVEIRNQRQAVELAAVDNMDRLTRWVEQARAVQQIAEGICSTSFAPAAYRGKPAEATAAILAGAELGFDPMASLRAFDNIQGVPAPKAITLRAVVQGAGHQVVIVESTPERAVVRGLRRGETEWQASTWDIGRAGMMGLLDKTKDPSRNPWLLQPAAMLVARATAEVCRWIASDAIMGMPYAAEEIGDQPHVEVRPIARKVTLADLDGEPAATFAEQREAYEAAHPEPMTDQQRKAMFGLWAELGFDNNSDADRATRLELIAKLLDLESLETTSDLNRDQADQVIAVFRQRLAAKQGGPQ
jgi:hypothetical protein